MKRKVRIKLGMLDPRAMFDCLKPSRGAYLLHINMPDEFLGTNRSFGTISLRPGDYVYLVSGRGAGGNAKRIARHCRAEKKILWHADHLTKAG